jgi:hypothetical protein
VHSDACKARNGDTIFAMLGWDRYGYDKKGTEPCYVKLMFLRRVGSVGHIVQSGASGARNCEALFFMLRWDRYGNDKKGTGTHYVKLMFLHSVGTVVHIVHSGGSEASNGDALFLGSVGTDTNSIKNAPGHVMPNYHFASGGICGSHSAFRCV